MVGALFAVATGEARRTEATIDVGSVYVACSGISTGTERTLVGQTVATVLSTETRRTKTAKAVHVVHATST